MLLSYRAWLGNRAEPARALARGELLPGFPRTGEAKTYSASGEAILPATAEAAATAGLAR